MNKQIVLKDLSSGKSHVVELPCVLGRDKEVDVAFADGSISRRHAILTLEFDGIWIEDLKSRNGVFVNGSKIEHRALLYPGDFVQIGKTRLRVSVLEEEPSDQTVVLHTVDLTEESQLNHQRLMLIYEITRDLAESQNLPLLGEKLFSRFKEIFKQDRGYMALFQDDGTLKPVLLDPPMESVPLSRSIVNRVFQNGESFILADALSEASFNAEESVMALNIRSALCVPLIYHKQIYGIFYLDRNVPGAYEQDDLEFLRTISSILAPLIENARLWSELKSHYDSAVETLRETQAKLIEMERTTAYARLAQAMAHEIRNPLMVIGGLVRRLSQANEEGSDGGKIHAVMESVERIDAVLKEVDSFVSLSAPERKLERIDLLIEEEIEAHQEEWLKHGIHPVLTVNTPHVKIPVDPELFRKALSLIFRVVLSNVSQGSELPISVAHSGNDVDILFGEANGDRCSAEPFDAELQNRPWSLDLFLNMAHKIVSDHGGKLLVDPTGHSAFPINIKMPRTVRM